MSRKVLKSSEYQDILNAKEILLQAEIKAEKILYEARKMKQSAYQEGYQSGLQQVQIDNAEHTMNLVAESISYLGKIEKDVSNIVFASVRKIIATYEPDELAIQSIKAGVKELSNSKQILLRAAPDLAKVLFNRISEINTATTHINLVTDERLENNHCTIESDLGIIHVNAHDMVDRLQQIVDTRL